ncbi:unnamed protein product, partial [Prorocentrum cordatum]
MDDGLSKEPGNFGDPCDWEVFFRRLRLQRQEVFERDAARPGRVGRAPALVPAPAAGAAGVVRANRVNLSKPKAEIKDLTLDGCEIRLPFVKVASTWEDAHAQVAMGKAAESELIAECLEQLGGETHLADAEEARLHMWRRVCGAEEMAADATTRACLAEADAAEARRSELAAQSGAREAAEARLEAVEWRAAAGRLSAEVGRLTEALGAQGSALQRALRQGRELRGQQHRADRAKLGLVRAVLDEQAQEFRSEAAGWRAEGWQQCERLSAAEAAECRAELEQSQRSAALCE